MTIRTITEKLHAWEAGEPLPRYSTIHHAVMPEDQVLIVAFVRMGGESRPWGIAWGAAGAPPTISSVPDGRVRDDVAVLCADFAEDLLEHMRVHNWTFNPLSEKPDEAELQQVWLPNGQHLAMLHHLAYAYSQTRFGGTNQEILQALGRLAGWLFRDSSRRGHQHVIDASSALSDAFVFPAQNSRTAHLGYQLAWLTTSGDRDDRLEAAEKAEGLTVSPTMDPVFERDELAARVEAWNDLRRGAAQTDEIEKEIGGWLRAELQRRWDLTERAYRFLQQDERRVNVGVERLVAEAHKEFWFQHQRIELRLNDSTLGPAFVAHPETDFHGSAAASRYLIYSASDEAYFGHLVHDDRLLFEEALDDGMAVRGRVVDVGDNGVGKSTVPVWTIELDPERVHRIRENNRVVPYGSSRHEAVVTAVEVTSSGARVEIEWQARKTMRLEADPKLKPADAGWIGRDVAFVISDAATITRLRSSRIWKAKDGPGAWLTHGSSKVPVTIEADDGATDELVDDISQIEDNEIV